MLSVGYLLSVSSDFRWIIVRDFRLPPGFNYFCTDVLVEIPQDYPCSPPGVAAHVYLSPKLRFKGQELQDLHEGTTPGWGDWAWFCYSKIDWDPNRDDLIKFMEMVRADLTNPGTK
jgi:hypothetical protein